MPEHGHPDRTPSLRLYLDDDRWYCFACSPQAGDVIQWVTQTEQVSWRQAIAILDSGRLLTHSWTGHPRTGGVAQRAGPLPVSRAVDAPELGRTSPFRVQQALDTAWDAVTSQELHERGARYLAGRGIDVRLLESRTGQAEVGHTPAERDGLVERLTAAGFTPDELVDAGLALRRQGDNRLVDFYRRRVLLPIRDPDGRLAGMAGRNVGHPGSPKYLNPPRTARYDKALTIYQPLPAPTHPAGQVIVVEGILDALAIAAAAIRARYADRYCPVTQSGRTLSAGQLDRIATLHSGPLVLAMDGDRPGQEANRHLAALAAASGHPAITVALPSAHDPASFLAVHGPAGLLALTSTHHPDDRPGPPGVEPYLSR